MGEEQNKEYYDNLFRKFKHYSLDVNGYDSPWNKVYKLVKKFLNKDERILELGCGTGQFAEVLISEGFNYIYGMDFSQQGISMAKERCKKDFFECVDLYDFDFTKIDFDVAIAVEVFEHIGDDMMIIDKLSKGTRIIFSVPQYDAGGHVRFFPHRKDVVDRFESKFSKFTIDKTGSVFVINAIK